jgi:3-oxoacyl-[acyl-carrier-protein] synthase II
MSRAYVTGLGAVTALGCDVDTTFAQIAAGRSGVRPLESPQLRPHVAAAVADFTPPPGTAAADRSIQFAVRAADEAIRCSGLSPDALAAMGARAAVAIGSSKGCILDFAARHARWLAANRSPDALGPADWPFWSTIPPHAVADAVAARYQIHGPRHTPVAACATGTLAVIQAAHWIEAGRADIVVAGAADASIHPLWLAAFDRMGVLARPRGLVPAQCRPFDADRNGFVVGEGAGILILESAASVERRGATPLAVIESTATGADGRHLIDADPTGGGVETILRLALERALRSPADLDLIQAHGTGTRANDAAEAAAYRRINADRPTPCPVSAAKGAVGHVLGAAGSVELVLCVQMLRRGMILPSVNHARPDRQTRSLDLVTTARSLAIRRLAKLSLGFGGHLAAILLRTTTT